MSGVSRVVVLWVPDFPVLACGGADGLPVAVVHRDVVVACSGAARTAGVRRRMQVRAAQARCPGLRIVERDLTAEIQGVRARGAAGGEGGVAAAGGDPAGADRRSATRGRTVLRRGAAAVRTADRCRRRAGAARPGRDRRRRVRGGARRPPGQRGDRPGGRGRLIPGLDLYRPEPRGQHLRAAPGGRATARPSRAGGGACAADAGPGGGSRCRAAGRRRRADRGRGRSPGTGRRWRRGWRARSACIWAPGG
ncbi:hypothetical protein [Streptomyces albidoflavus]|uniref:Y-family DNA polymerase n=1 Tax=Streptomyces albidoflavus TaxID=1886 RepID=UPI001F5C6399|nr:hypothetical protein [Streptomyces albidoflavus]